MSFIIMAVQEEGSETRISDYDEISGGFISREAAYRAVERACEDYVEYRQIWVEELQDMTYWQKRIAAEEYEDF